MERKIGETFEYMDSTIQTINDGGTCEGCFFYNMHCYKKDIEAITGECLDNYRDDKTNVKFIKIK